ncbi:fimbria/pilus periplasmic chaperone [Burkholderia sp. Ac-20353]|uniref:fimbrial biogenesis chaperone n=1 Tax=Burkholderia sp. Ac-20353 TaxID=2703894 RepID=UPI00197B875D|nr:fimbria/pilus periplasmic chaperone [Burkholderia sp. Ac-20353]MBN3790747.1 fimbria/pilus periplasmic chaperone [Burkholderia sp. Ac-20353]
MRIAFLRFALPALRRADNSCNRRIRRVASCFASRFAHPYRFARAAAVVLAVSALPRAADAGLSVVGTRFVYTSDARALAISARNLGDAPILVQAWLDDGRADADPSVMRVPFVVTPPLTRVEPKQRLAFRVQAVGQELPADRESRYWINLLEVPPAAEHDDNTLRIAYRLRMKVLFRPIGLAGTPREAPDRLRWTLAAAQSQSSLVATNPSPYYVTLTRVETRGAALALAGGAIDVAPFGQVEIPLGVPPGTGPDEIVFDAVGDDGVVRTRRATLAPP